MRSASGPIAAPRWPAPMSVGAPIRETGGIAAAHAVRCRGTGAVDDGQMVPAVGIELTTY